MHSLFIQVITKLNLAFCPMVDNICITTLKQNFFRKNGDLCCCWIVFSAGMNLIRRLQGICPKLILLCDCYTLEDSCTVFILFLSFDAVD